MDVRNRRHDHIGQSALREFPLPLNNLSAVLHVKADRVEVERFDSVSGDAKLFAQGLVRWGKIDGPDQPRTTRAEIGLTVENLPIDRDLAQALPADTQERLEQLGLAGKLNGTGVVTVNLPSGGQNSTDYRFDMKLTDGVFRPREWKTQVDHITSLVRITPDEIRIDDAKGQRDDSAIAANGSVGIKSGGVPVVNGEVTATKLLLDAPLHDSLPTPARAAWDAVKPSGHVTTRLKWNGSIEDAAAWHLTLDAGNDVSVEPTFFPRRFDALTGTVRASSTTVELDAIKAKLADSDVQLDGTGALGPASNQQLWKLKLGAAKLPIDEKLLVALPTGLAGAIRDAKFAGTVDLTVRRLDWSSEPDPADAAKVKTTVGFDAGVKFADARAEFGLPISSAVGGLEMSGSVNDDGPTDLAGAVSLDSFKVADIDATAGSARLTSQDSANLLHIVDVRAKLAGGDLSGEVAIDQSNVQSTRWARTSASGRPTSARSPATVTRP
ncbi:MAG: hypothetical protein QM770_14875 [Tepidisphaeraceae bacterium]